MDQPDESTTTRHSTRRKLLRGALASPAVLTLHSPGALAATTNFRCIGTGTIPATQVTATDGFLRVQLWSQPATSDGASTLRAISGADLVGPRRLSVVPATTQWRRYNTALEALDGDFEMLNSDGNLPSPWARTAEYVLVRFDQEGTIVAVGGEAADSDAVTGSCWSSFSRFLR